MYLPVIKDKQIKHILYVRIRKKRARKERDRERGKRLPNPSADYV